VRDHAEASIYRIEKMASVKTHIAQHKHASVDKMARGREGKGGGQEEQQVLRPCQRTLRISFPERYACPHGHQPPIPMMKDRVAELMTCRIDPAPLGASDRMACTLLRTATSAFGMRLSCGRACSLTVRGSARVLAVPSERKHTGPAAPAERRLTEAGSAEPGAKAVATAAGREQGD